MAHLNNGPAGTAAAAAPPPPGGCDYDSDASAEAKAVAAVNRFRAGRLTRPHPPPDAPADGGKEGGAGTNAGLRRLKRSEPGGGEDDAPLPRVARKVASGATADDAIELD